jgi:hypothetical protein
MSWPGEAMHDRERGRGCSGSFDRAMIVVAIRGEQMEGIQFVTDDKGKKVAVQIDLERYGELWEDIHESARRRVARPREERSL